MIHEFLEEFTKELIISSSLNLERPVQLQPQMNLPSLQNNFQQSIASPRVVQGQAMQRPQLMRPPQKIRPLIRIKKPLRLSLRQGEDKADYLLKDPRVMAVECPGPGKLIKIKKGLRTELTNLKMSEKEIKEKIDDFSKKSNIPLIGGLFKATVGNLTMTAVVSDYAGSRFIINKFMQSNLPQLPEPPQNPFPQPQPRPFPIPQNSRGLRPRKFDFLQKRQNHKNLNNY